MNQCKQYFEECFNFTALNQNHSLLQQTSLIFRFVHLCSCCLNLCGERYSNNGIWPQSCDAYFFRFFMNWKWFPLKLLCTHAGAGQLSLLILSIVCVCVVFCLPCCLICCLEDDFEEVSGTVRSWVCTVVWVWWCMTNTYIAISLVHMSHKRITYTPGKLQAWSCTIETGKRWSIV